MAITKAQVALVQRTQVDQDYVVNGLLRIIAPRLDDPSPAQAAVATRGLELLGTHIGMFVKRHVVSQEGPDLQRFTLAELLALRDAIRGRVVEGTARQLPQGDGDGPETEG